MSLFTDNIAANIAVQTAILNDTVLLGNLEQAAEVCLKALKENKKLLFCGNGGSAADAQHLAAEFTGRFYLNRPALYAEALHVNTSYLTAVANDYSFDVVYSRMIDGIGQAGDVLVAISTSGNSNNILLAIEAAKAKGMTVIGLTGKTGGKMATVVDILLNAPSSTTPRIQEAHILMGHCICESVEAEYFKES